MQSKLTLRLDQSLIEKAKRYSQKIGKPVSRIVADYFRSIDNAPANDIFQMTPLVKSLKGSLGNARVGIADYHSHLEDKYL